MMDFDFSDEAIATRTSDIYGEINMYAPDCAPSEWSHLPFLVTTQHGYWRVVRREVTRINPDTLVMETREQASGFAEENREGPGIRLLVRSSRAHDAFIRLGSITMSDLWEDETAEVMSL